MIIAGLVYSLLKAIHEWTACGRAVPTYFSPLAELVGPHQSSREGTFTDHRERDKATGSMSGWSRIGSRTSLVQFRVLGLRRITRVVGLARSPQSIPEFLSTGRATEVRLNLLAANMMSIGHAGPLE
jgi:hypothetical protein